LPAADSENDDGVGAPTADIDFNRLRVRRHFRFFPRWSPKSGH
jgi:hypothetical protein